MTDWGMLFIAIGLYWGFANLGSGIEDGLAAIAEAIKECDDDQTTTK